MLKEYFTKKEYKYLYLSKFSCVIASTLQSIFSTVMLYKKGISISNILLIYALNFGLMGVLSPLFLTFSKRIGVAYTALIANICKVISVFILLFINSNLIFLLIIFMAVSGALANPMQNTLHSKYVLNENRGKFNSLIFLCKTLGTAIASIIITVGITTNSQIMVFVIVSICYFLDFVFMKMVDFKPTRVAKNSFAASFKYLLNSKNKISKISLLRAFSIIERIFLPLYIYTFLNDIVLFTIVIVASVLVQIIVIIFNGRLSDKNEGKTFTVMAYIKAIISILFMFFKDKFLISINKILYDNVEDNYDMNYRIVMQNYIKKSKDDDELISIVQEMGLCLVEIIFLTMFSIISIYIKEKIFILIFATSIISLLITEKLVIKLVNEIKNWKIKNILLAGFKAETEYEKSSEELLNKISTKYCKKKIYLENDFSISEEQLKTQLSKEKYSSIVIFGRKPDTKSIYVETVGRKGEEEYFTNYEFDYLIKCLNSNSYDAVLSENAGEYLCNNIYFTALKYIKENNLDTKVIFVHIPDMENIDNIYHMAKTFSEYIG